MNDYRLKISEPVTVARSKGVSPSESLPWGVFQFPWIERQPDGRLFVTYSLVRDSEESYGKTKGYAYSDDNGSSWKPTDENLTLGIDAGNGERLRLIELEAEKVNQSDLPPIDPKLQLCDEVKFYHNTDFSNAENAYPMERRDPVSGEWKLEMKQIKLPDNACRKYIVATGLLPYNMLWYLKKAPNGIIWAISYDYFSESCNGGIYFHAYFMTSEDGGKTFVYKSDIPYQPDPSGDPVCYKRAGFTEPNLTFLPGGRILCLLRTDGPMYVSVSDDGGNSWSRPKIFDELGVWPALTTLGCGVTIATYGRPGVFLRSTGDPTGEVWQPRVDIGNMDLTLPAWRTSCSYTSIAPIDDTRAIVVYSDFNYPGDDGQPHKTILARILEVEF